jgi:hypothetical protein
VEQVPNPTGVDPITGSEQKEAKIKKKKKQNKTQNKNKKQQTTASQSSLQTYRFYNSLTFLKEKNTKF